MTTNNSIFFKSNLVTAI